MTAVFLTVLLSHLLLAASGLSLMQLATSGRRLRLLPCLPYAWPTGVVVLYAVGYLFVGMGWWSMYWNYAAIATMLLLTAAGAVLWLRTPPSPSVTVPAIRPRDWIFILLIAAKWIAVFYGALNYPVIDSDAAAPDGYVSLAKKIGEGTVFQGGWTASPLGPSMLAAWARMPLDRWYDSMVALPWLFAWLSFTAISGYTCYRLTRHTTASLACAYLFCSVPLAVNHALRPGFNDLLVACFFMAAISVFCFFYLDRRKVERCWLLVAGACLVCGALSKMEGKAWFVLLSVIGASYWLYALGKYPWRKILLFQLAAAVVVYLLYLLTGDFISQYVGGRMQALLEVQYDPESFSSFFSALFSYGSFNMFWWIFVPMALFALVSRTDMSARALVIYMLAIVFLVFYISNFTGNVAFTMMGTNVGRFFLQISGMMLPIYCIFAQQLLEIMSRQPAAGRK